MQHVQPIILAAGAANRFGACKLLLRYRNKSLLQHCVDTAASLQLPEPIIVSGAWHRQLEETHPQLDLREHRGWRGGMGSSLAFGIRQLPAQCEAALVLLADQLAVSGADIACLLEEWRKHRRIVCSFYAGRRGVPAIFPRRVFHHLEGLDNDRGARGLLRDQQADVVSVPIANGAIDIDTPEDWQAYGEE
ncbi:MULTISPECIES: nucleotidyltransferase family protein [Microbulbifer]|uniref:nucleotidyltransferase family protein n=1 Tax=Microbulbifer TaxID=48073 RepID=UPI001E5BE964|nr:MULTISPECIES: nucleotidyltransferase family protein [Microbulbifer]UHQ54911.1 nucleotidyltransferase family protein [Microbulbifer sp. YPW16]